MEKIILPRGYLSHSQVTLWEKNKDAYRVKYYYGGESFSNKETHFGSKIHKLLETEPDHPWIRHIPRFDTPEYAIDIVIDGIRVKGQIDAYCSKSGNFRDYKTGHADKKGNPPWNDLKVRKHDQLAWYAMLLDHAQPYGNNGYRTAYIDWIETEKEIGIGYDGDEEYETVLGMKLTGNFKTFPRQIAKYERELQQVRLVTVAREISIDYSAEMAKL